jgi:putative ABC transport system permease protein
MTSADMLRISFGNMWRMKLRTFLTVAGIVIAIAAFVSMISFGAGNQQNIEREYNKLGLFTTMQVYPKESKNDSGVVSKKKLDKKALDQIGSLPGVNLVYPYDAFDVKIRFGDSVVTSRAQAISSNAVQTKLFSNLSSGNSFTADSLKQLIVSSDLVKKLGIALPDSIVGKQLIVSVQVSQLDSGLTHIIREGGVSLWDRIKKIHFDSLLDKNYRNKIIRNEVNGVVQRFINGFMNAQETISDTLVVCGVRNASPMGRSRIESVILPIATAEHFRSTGFSGNPIDLFTSISSGNFLMQSEDENGKSYPQITIDFDSHVPYENIKNSVEALGYKTFSFAEQFNEIQKFFFYFDMALGVVGLIALITASLGIVNTMVMSIIERKREIGILKSLGADERDIGILFLFESGVIGIVGTVLGIFIGWLITRLVSIIAQSYMSNQGIPSMDLFALPLWLIIISLVVGVGVSVLAGSYPASRAAKVDPVEALRND